MPHVPCLYDTRPQLWQWLDPSGSGFIRVTQLPRLLLHLPAPLGLAKEEPGGAHGGPQQQLKKLLSETEYNSSSGVGAGLGGAGVESGADDRDSAQQQQQQQQEEGGGTGGGDGDGDADPVGAYKGDPGLLDMLLGTSIPVWRRKWEQQQQQGNNSNSSICSYYVEYHEVLFALAARAGRQELPRAVQEDVHREILRRIAKARRERGSKKGNKKGSGSSGDKGAGGAFGGEMQWYADGEARGEASSGGGDRGGEGQGEQGQRQQGGGPRDATTVARYFGGLWMADAVRALREAGGRAAVRRAARAFHERGRSFGSARERVAFLREQVGVG